MQRKIPRRGLVLRKTPPRIGSMVQALLAQHKCSQWAISLTEMNNRHAHPLWTGNCWSSVALHRTHRRAQSTRPMAAARTNALHVPRRAAGLHGHRTPSETAHTDHAMSLRRLPPEWPSSMASSINVVTRSDMGLFFLVRTGKKKPPPAKYLFLSGG